MKDPAAEIQAVEADIALLQELIDKALDKGATAQDHYLRACAEVLYRRRKRLVELQNITLYRSRQPEDPPP